MIAYAAAFTSGLFTWTFLEYVLHRWGGHKKHFGKHVMREHLQHHATPTYFTSFPRKLILAVPVLSALALLSVPIFGWTGAIFVGGVAIGWTFYERLHRATHVRGPINRYGAWARRHHLHHHFGNPKVNHGVSVPLWDWVFGTLERPEVIRVPRRQVHAFAWLLAGDELDPRHAAEYRLDG